MASPFTTSADLREIELTGSTPVFKLHGSLNWTLESSGMLMYQDLRAAFRRGGEAAIVPPVDEKATPHWLEGAWKSVRDVLTEAKLWIVVGYSLPVYDTAVRDLLLPFTQGVHVALADPDSERLGKRWSEMLPKIKIHPLPGLPQALESLADTLQEIGG